MRCLYREKQYHCGNYLDVDIYPVYKAAGKRRGKAKPTSDVQANLNRRNAEKKLIRLMHTNFTEQDMEIHLTYTDNPQTEEEARRDLQNYIRRLKRMRAGLPALKYIAITERGTSESCRYHHHITINGGLDRDAAEQAWNKGRANSRRLQFDEYGVAGLACYITKGARNPETKEQIIWKKRWCASKNLQRPVERQNDYRYNARRVRDMFAQEDRRAVEQLYPGYLVADIDTLDNEFNNGTYVRLRLYRADVRLL
jgi:hypothetical protein